MEQDADVLIVGSGPIGTVAACRLAANGLRADILEEGSGSGEHVRNQDRFHREPDTFLAAALAGCEFPCQSAGSESGLPGVAVSRVVGGQGTLWTNNCPRPPEHELWSGIALTDWRAALAAAESLLGVADLFPASQRNRSITAALGPGLAIARREILHLPAAAHVENGAIHYHSAADILAHLPSDVRARIRVRSETRVERVVVEGSRASGVEVVAGAMHATLTAAHVIVAGGAVDTPRLLWRSGIRPPALGRCVTFHPVSVAQLILRPNLGVADGARDDPPRLWIPPTPTHPWHMMILRDLSPTPPPSEPAAEMQLIEIQTFCPIEPEWDNRMTIDEDGNLVFDVPLSAAVDARLRAIDADRAEIAAKLGRFRRGGEPQSMPTGFGHLMGTCRMGGVDDGTSVADSTGRVWGLDNLRLATVGLLPGVMAVNPTLAGAALAVRTADAIAAA